MDQKYSEKPCLEMITRKYIDSLGLTTEAQGQRGSKVTNLPTLEKIFDLFVENCRGAYIPTYSLTIDEQLLPMKTGAH